MRVHPDYPGFDETFKGKHRSEAECILPNSITVPEIREIIYEYTSRVPSTLNRIGSFIYSNSDAFVKTVSTYLIPGLISTAAFLSTSIFCSEYYKTHMEDKEDLEIRYSIQELGSDIAKTRYHDYPFSYMPYASGILVGYLYGRKADANGGASSYSKVLTYTVIGGIVGHYLLRSSIPIHRLFINTIYGHYPEIPAISCSGPCVGKIAEFAYNIGSSHYIWHHIEMFSSNIVRFIAPITNAIMKPGINYLGTRLLNA